MGQKALAKNKNLDAKVNTNIELARRHFDDPLVSNIL